MSRSYNDHHGSCRKPGSGPLPWRCPKKYKKVPRYDRKGRLLGMVRCKDDNGLPPKHWKMKPFGLHFAGPYGGEAYYRSSGICICEGEINKRRTRREAREEIDRDLTDDALATEDFMKQCYLNGEYPSRDLAKAYQYYYRQGYYKGESLLDQMWYFDA